MKLEAENRGLKEANQKLKEQMYALQNPNRSRSPIQTQLDRSQDITNYSAHTAQYTAPVPVAAPSQERKQPSYSPWSDNRSDNRSDLAKS